MSRKYSNRPYVKPPPYPYLCSIGLVVVVAALLFAAVSYNEESEYNNSSLSCRRNNSSKQIYPRSHSRPPRCRLWSSTTEPVVSSFPCRRPDPSKDMSLLVVDACAHAQGRLGFFERVRVCSLIGGDDSELTIALIAPIVYSSLLVRRCTSKLSIVKA